MRAGALFLYLHEDDVDVAHLQQVAIRALVVVGARRPTVALVAHDADLLAEVDEIEGPVTQVGR